MGESSGSSFGDVVGEATATIASGVTLGQGGGLVGDASTSALFDGSSGTASASVNLSGTHQLTLEFWMKWSAYAADDRLALEFTPNFNEYSGGFLVDPDATPGSDFAVALGSGGSRNTVYFERPSAGAWHYYTFVLDTEASAETQITPYVDGKAVSFTKTVSGTGAGNFANSTLFWMSRDASSLFGAGNMQALALYAGALSTGTIEHHYEVGEGGPHASFASLPVQATAGVPVRLDASGSTSPVGSVTDYAWDFDGGKGYGTDAGSSPTLSHTFSSPGTYTIDLRVTDGTSATATVSQTITVGAALGEYEQEVEDTAGIAHFWPMGEAFGSSFADVVEGADAEVLGGVTLGEAGGTTESTTGALFDGSSGAARANVDLSGTKKVTVEFWLKWSAFAEDDHLAMEFTPNFNEDPGGFLIDPNASGSGKFGLGLGLGETRNNAFFGRPSAEHWHYYAFVLDTTAAGASEIKPYVDGHLVSYTKGAEGIEAGVFSKSVLYWMSRGAGSLFGEGAMQDVALYEGVLSKTTILHHYEIGAGLPTEPAAAFSSLPVRATVGIPVIFDATASSSLAGPIGDYSWDFDGGKGYGTDTGSTATETHTFSSPGTYTVDLRVEDEDGATGTVSHTITVGSALPAYAQAVEKSAGISHFWPMGEASGSTFGDAFAGADATTVGGVTLGEAGGLLADPESASATFDGSSAAASAAVDLSSTHELTVEFWMKWSAYAADDRLALEFTPNFNENAGGFLVDPDAIPGSDFAVSIGQGGSRNSVFFERPSAGAWHYYTFVIDTEASAEAEITPYVDGKAVSYTKSESVGTGAGKFANSTLYWMSRDASSLFGAGSMQDLAMYAGTLSAGAIEEHYELGVGELTNTETPGITGTVEDGQTLTANPGSWTGPEPITYAYQWQSCDSLGEGCLDISGATGSSYEVVPGDVGGRLRVVVTATNPVGSVEAISEASDIVEAVPPSNSVLPTISGSTKEEDTLTASSGSWAGSPPLAYSYQWRRCNESGESCSDIDGAADSAYQLGAGDVGNTIRVAVTASNEGGATTVVASSTATIETSATAPVNLAPPALSGTTQTDETLVAGPGTWTGAPPLTYTYQWETCNSVGENCKNVPGATDPTYQLGAGDIGERLRVLVTVGNEDGLTSLISRASATIEDHPSPESDCTDTWIGPSKGQWGTAEYWSQGVAPTSSDIACIGAATEVTLGADTYQVGALRDEGEFVMQGGSLELSDADKTSTVSTLKLSGSSPILTGPGTLFIEGHLEWIVGEMQGSGETVIGGSATATLKPSPFSAILKERGFVNEGILTFASGWLGMSEGALLENRGTFEDNSQSCESCEGVRGQILSFSEPSGAPPRVLNIGTFEKTQGTGTSGVVVNFTNDGIVAASTGTLKFVEGGTPEAAATGSWSVEGGASVALVEGFFPIAEGVDLLAVDVEEGATVERTPAPQSSSAPSISGSAEVGQTMTTDGGSWSGSEPISLAYQWQRCNPSGTKCGAITEATGSTYVLVPADIDTTVRVLVTASNSYGQAFTASPASETIQPPPPPSNTTLPSIAGATRDGQTLTAGSGSWSAVAPISYAYQWESCNPSGEECASLEGETTSEYQLTEGDVGSTLRVVVMATNSGGSTEASSPASFLVEAEPPSELEPPSISGMPEVHKTLQADGGIWTGTETQLSYQWESCSESGGECAPIEGATDPEYDLTEGDVSTTLRVRVGVGSAIDSLSDVSEATVVIGASTAFVNDRAPVISGAPQVGQGLTAGPGDWSGTSAISYAYQWQTCDLYEVACNDIEGATDSNYVPVSGDAGERVRVHVTATNEESDVASRYSQATQPVAEEHAPVVERQPPILGAVLSGSTLTGATGVVASDSPTYTYQWQRCASAGSCEPIEGATEDTYTLTSGDVGSRIWMLVTVTNSHGSTTAVSYPTTEVHAEALTELSPPSISGVVQSGGTLVADPGIWSASGHVSYSYQWEKCNTSGEECEPIEGASEQTYVDPSGELGSTLRVAVTVTSPLGSKNAVSAHTSAWPDGEASVEEAQTILQETDPAIIAASTTASLEEQSVAPGLKDTEEELESQDTLTTSTISKESPGEFAVNTPVGELSIAPVEVSPNATTLPTIINGAAALFANTWPATDTVVRAESLGIETFLQIRSPEAPHTFSWEARLGPDQELTQLPDGSVAIVEAAEETSQPSNDAEETGESGPLRGTSEGPPETEEEKADAEGEEPESGSEEETPLVSLPGSPETELTAGEARAGLPEPQQTQNSYETSRSAMATAEALYGDRALMVIVVPTVTDAEGHTISTTLGLSGGAIRLTIKPGFGTVYPLLADYMVMAPSDKTSEERDPIKYGLSDPSRDKTGHFDEHIDENGLVAPGFDPNLKNGPLHVKTVRLVIPYDVVTLKDSYTAAEKARLEEWLIKVGKEHLQPLVTITKDYEKDPCGEKEKSRCDPPPSVSSYQKAIARLMRDLVKGNPKRGFPPVELWGAWNEPDAGKDPLHKDWIRAVRYWEAANSTLARLSKQLRPKGYCRRCAVLAGEFAYASGYERGYTSRYRNFLLYGQTKLTGGAKILRHPVPVVWGFHDYYDVVERQRDTAADFAKFTDAHALGRPRIFMSEAGVQLSGGKKDVEVRDGEGEVALTDHLELQAGAAETFLNLYTTKASREKISRLDREYYFMYTAPGAMERKSGEFDSALLEAEGGVRRERPAYCVLAYHSHLCPPAVETTQKTFTVGVNICSSVPTSIPISGFVEPNGAKTLSYEFRYGPTTSYGKTTGTKNLPRVDPWARSELHVEIPVTEFEEAGHGRCPSTIHYQLIATNAQGSRSSVDKAATFVVDVG